RSPLEPSDAEEREHRRVAYTREQRSPRVRAPHRRLHRRPLQDGHDPTRRPSRDVLDGRTENVRAPEQPEPEDRDVDQPADGVERVRRPDQPYQGLADTE